MAQLYTAGGNALPGSGDPTTVVGQTGLNQEFVLYVADAYRDVQNAQEQWNFKRRRGYLRLPAGSRVLSTSDIEAQIPDYETIQPDLIGGGYRFLLFNQATDPYVITGTYATFNPGSGPPYWTVGSPILLDNGPVIPTSLSDGTVISFVKDDIAMSITLSMSFSNSSVQGSPFFAVGQRIYDKSTLSYFTMLSLDGYTLTDDGDNSQHQVDYATYQDWRGNLDRGRIPTGAPYLYTIRPDGSLEFNATTNVPYTITIDYYTKVVNWTQVATAEIPDPNLQTPIFPSRYHEIIAWGAVMKWAAVRESPGKFGFAKNNYERVMNDLCVNELPETQLCLNQFYSPYSMGAYGL